MFLVPGLSMLGYLSGARVGAATYNVVHSYVLPVVLTGTCLYFSAPLGIALGLVWTAHIGVDRALGYGLKYSQGFRYTHLGTIGRSRDSG